MNEQLQMIYLAVLAGLGTIGPKPLQRRLDLEAEDSDLDVSLASLLQHLRSTGPNDAVKRQFSLQFALWDDADESEPWTGGHDRRTSDRRVCDLSTARPTGRVSLRTHRTVPGQA